MAVTLPTYDTRHVETTTATLSQQGTDTSGTWADASFPFTLSASTTYMGLTFDFSVTTESERSLLLAPRIPFTNVTDDLAGTSETDRYWTLTLTTSNTSIPSQNFPLTGLFVAAPGLWSSGNLPSTLTNDIALTTIASSSSEWTLNGSTYDFVFQIDFNASFAVDGVTTTHVFAKLVNDPAWNGRLLFAVRGTPTSTPQFVVTGATFSGLTNGWHTGAMDMPNRRGRVVHDYITGAPYMSDEAVQDGFRDGIMIHPDNWDPDDPKDRDPWVPPPGEGVVEDEIVDLE